MSLTSAYGIIARATSALNLCYGNERSVVRSRCFVYGTREESQSEGNVRDVICQRALRERVYMYCRERRECVCIIEREESVCVLQSEKRVSAVEACPREVNYCVIV